MGTHYLTVDVEEHFQVSAFEGVVDPADWGRHPSRVAANVDRVLQLCSDHGARATFFVLGWIAQRHQELVKRIAAAGHEVASHGWDHRRVTHQTPAEFRRSVRETKALLEDQVGRETLGFRAPSFSIVAGREWALDVLLEEGYRYDSSLFPVRRPGYGYPGGGRDPYTIRRAAGDLAEFPPATWRRWGRNLPAGGGAYLRILPFRVVRDAVRDYDRRGACATLYLHPWEVDPEQPRLAVPLLARLRHYTGLRRTLPRLKQLLAEFRFTAICDGLARVPAAEPN